MSVQDYIERVKNISDRSEIEELNEEFKKFSLGDMITITTAIGKLAKETE